MNDRKQPLLAGLLAEHADSAAEYVAHHIGLACSPSATAIFCVDALVGDASS
jgi:hypothetical protein